MYIGDDFCHTLFIAQMNKQYSMCGKNRLLSTRECRILQNMNEIESILLGLCVIICSASAWMKSFVFFKNDFMYSFTAGSWHENWIKYMFLLQNAKSIDTISFSVEVNKLRISAIPRTHTAVQLNSRNICPPRLKALWKVLADVENGSKHSGIPILLVQSHICRWELLNEYSKKKY